MPDTVNIFLITFVTFDKLCVCACNIYISVLLVTFCIFLNMCCNILSTVAEQTST